MTLSMLGESTFHPLNHYKIYAHGIKQLHVVIYNNVDVMPSKLTAFGHLDFFDKHIAGASALHCQKRSWSDIILQLQAAAQI